MPSRVRWAGGAWLLLLAAAAFSSVSESSAAWWGVLLTFAGLGATLAWGALLATHRLRLLLFWSIPVGATLLFVPVAVAETRDEFAADASDFTFLIIASLMIVAMLIAAGAACAATLRRFRMSPIGRSSQPMQSTARWACGAWLLLLAVYAWIDGGSLEDSSGWVTALAIASLVATVAWGALITIRRLWPALIWSSPLGATVLTVAITTSFMRDESGVDSFYPQWIFVISLVEIAVLTAAGAGSTATWRLIRTRLGARHHHPSIAEPTLANERDAT